MPPQNEEVLKLEERLEAELGVTKKNVPQFMGVSPTSWYEYRTNTRRVPKYIQRSIEAHLLLPDLELDELSDSRIENASK